MNPDANPFIMKRPIDIAMDEIKLLKKVIVELRNELEPLKEDLNKRQKKLAEEEAEYEKIVKNSWW